jgi:ribosomal protein S18 acetylase RimI-like enzyme
MNLSGEGFYLQILADARQPQALPRREVLEEILEVYRQCEDFLALGPQPRASMEMVLGDLKISREEGGVFCAIRPASVTPVPMPGIVDFVPTGWEGDARAGFLSLLMIGAPYRSHGLGEAVVRAVEAEIRRDGRAQGFRSGVQVNNPGAIRFWQRMGFQIITEAEALPDGTVCYQLLKSL